MGSLILCHKTHAKQPYEISRTHTRIYTVEELCYYLGSTLYLIDSSLMNKQFCNWVEEELDMQDLAEKLRKDLARPCTEEQFVLTILQGSHMYSDSELEKMEATLEKLQNERDVEKVKYRADHLMESGEYEFAAQEYQSIIGREWDDSLDKKFYGRVYACLGSAYGRLFLYEDASNAYREAYEICEDEDMLKNYLYCCRMYLPHKDYMNMLSGNPLYLSLDGEIKKDIEGVRRETDFEPSTAVLKDWKDENR